MFLFDEPLSNLDAELRVQMRVELKRLHERLETTAIYVTHDQVEAMTLGDRVVVMKDGRVQQVGEPLELYEPAGQPVRRRLHRLAGDELRRRLDPAERRAAGPRRAGLRMRVPPERRSAARYAGQRVTLGVRPEALRSPTARTPDYSFATTVEVVEPLGYEILLNFRAGGAPMVARVDPGVRVKVHENMRLALDPERAALLRRRDRSRDLRLPVADAHLHVWDPQAHYYPWLCDREPIAFRYGDYSSLRRRYSGRRLPRRLRPAGGRARRLHRGGVGSARSARRDGFHRRSVRKPRLPDRRHRASLAAPRRLRRGARGAGARMRSCAACATSRSPA